MQALYGQHGLSLAPIYFISYQQLLGPQATPKYSLCHRATSAYTHHCRQPHTVPCSLQTLSDVHGFLDNSGIYMAGYMLGTQQGPEPLCGWSSTIPSLLPLGKCLPSPGLSILI